MLASACFPDSSGIASTRRRVYGWAASRKSVPVGPTSLSRPPYMTAAHRERRHHREVVAHVDGRDAVGRAECPDGFEHMRLRRDVQARGRLVEDDHARPVGEGHRKRHPLLLPARQLVRVTPKERLVARQQHLSENLHDSRTSFGVRCTEAVLSERLLQLPSDAHRRAECGGRILRHVGDQAAAKPLAFGRRA